VVCIGLATVVEKYHGTSFVGEHIYGSWWFSALWAVLTVVACAYMLQQRLYKRLAVMLLHLSFVVILAGALTTHLFARRGIVRLRTNVPEAFFIDHESRVHQLPFSLELKAFSIVNYPGTDAPLDYQSVISCSDGRELVVSMNNIGHVDGYRLFQSSYDYDGAGVTLGLSYDPYGIAITYVGYLMLLLGIIATLLSRKTQMRALYRRATAMLLLLVSINAHANLQTVDKDIAHRLGTIPVLYNNRICPLNTVATDFVTKLTGSASWEGYSADEIFASWMIYYSPWEQQKLIRVKNHDVQQLLGISGQWASYSDFVNEYHEYKLQAALEAQRTGHATVDTKALMEADEKYHLVEMFYNGQFIRMFPYQSPSPLGGGEGGFEGSTVNWFSPGAQTLPKEIPVKEQFFIKQAMDFLTESIVTGQRDRAFEIIAKIKLFQREMIGELLPSEHKMQVEIFYNTLRSQKWPVFLSLAFSLLLCVAMLASFGGKRLKVVELVFAALLLVYLTLQLALRWWLSGHIPVSNGPETMLFMAWVLLLLTFLLCRKFPIIVAFGPLVGSFCLLVAMLGGSSSQLTPLMPVLQSPLLSIHVMTVMCAYALFDLQLLMGLHALVIMRKGKRNSQLSSVEAPLDKITALSQLMLYPAVFLLAIGIFLGAVWANVSWGNYWSWDPKESWALITLMVYAVPLHRVSIPAFNSPRFYHIYMVSAFLAVLITYFGVNYLLGGMHSYA
jgi:cytochrome c-type biogenesis protein CcsB